MNQYHFDLISDLYLSEDDAFDWTGQATSSVCIIAGNVSNHRPTLVRTLRHIAACYKHTFFIDGWFDHLGYDSDLDESYSDMEDELSKIPSFVFLQNRIVILDNFAVIGTNGWSTFDINSEHDYNDSKDFLQQKYETSEFTMGRFEAQGIGDARYLDATVARLQKHPGVQKIIIVSAAIPSRRFVQHCPQFKERIESNMLGNSYLDSCTASDLSNKMFLWAFGGYAGDVDTVYDEVRYVANAKGASDDPLHKYVYYPKRVGF